MLQTTERKTERLSTRLTPTQKQLFARAAELSGMEVTEFVISKAQQAAETTIHDYTGVIRLAVDDQTLIYDALTQPGSKPTPELTEAIDDYQSTVQSR